LNPNSIYVESGLRVDFIFHPWMHSKLKKSEIKNLKKNSKSEKPLKTPQKTPKETNL
jgi:hypothetical protein